MSKANVEVVRRWVDAYNRRDLDGLIALCDSEIEIRSYFVTIERVFRGHEGIHEYFKGLDEAYAHFQLVPIEFIDAGAAVVFAGHVDWRGKESGAGGTTQIVPALWLRAGKVFRTETFTDRMQALEAVGLTEQEARAASTSA
jgi:ketosteroid isomerase-like protein